MINSNIEFLVHCDEEGKTIGPISRKHAHIPEVRKLLCHKAVIAMVFCEKDSNWCFQKKKIKGTNKEIWDVSIGGHCIFECSGNSRFLEDDYDKTLKKESFEELGINLNLKDITYEIFNKKLYKNHFNNEFVALALIKIADKDIIIPQDDEVLDYKWVNQRGIEEFKDNFDISNTIETFFEYFENKI